MTPLHEIVKVIENRWYPIQDIAVIIAYHLKVAGLHWTSSFELSRMLIELTEIKFLLINPENITEVRVNPHYLEGV